MTEYKNNNTFSFEITKKIPGKLGRAGIIHTPHGDIKTPAFMCWNTWGSSFCFYGGFKKYQCTGNVKQWLSLA